MKDLLGMSLNVTVLKMMIPMRTVIASWMIYGICIMCIGGWSGVNR